MRMTRQRQRMERRARATGPITNINIVSLLDIFTILLLFLLVQSGDPTEDLPVLANLKLPYSDAKTSPTRTLVVSVVAGDIQVEGVTVAQVAELSDSNLIVPLASALKARLQDAAGQAGKDQKFSGRVTVMADRDVPFSVLKKVLFTCSTRHFRKVSLVVQRRVEDAG